MRGAPGSSAWRGYYAKTGSRPPRETLIRALDAFDREGGPGFAVDLGCGSGRDTVGLLRRGWRVLAIDAEAAAIEALTARGDLPAEAAMQVRVCRFETAEWPAADLVNASFSLPLCPPEAFGRLWRAVTGSLKPGGRFAGQLYGDRDQWAGDPGITFFSRAELDGLLDGLRVEYFREEEDDSITPRGHAKHWHIFHVTARRPVSAGP